MPTKPSAAKPVYIRWMIARDLSRVLEIESSAFRDPWPEEEFLQYLRNRNAIGMVAVENSGAPSERIVGYMLYELDVKSLEIANFAVAEDCRRQGVGRALIEKLKNKLTPQRRSAIKTLVREGNLDAQLFFKAMGFVARGMVKGAYECTDECGIAMMLRVGQERWAHAYKNRISEHFKCDEFPSKCENN